MAEPTYEELKTRVAELEKQKTLRASNKTSVASSRNTADE